ncbi:hypothetical protein [Oscillibacter sp.]|uniref:hypothetical protein n=1 Tax=Oscillibacter sp. TaxID=1945593 RepID=UPI0028A092F8|nr:hypothetical protein [Oscillibacter sp.]
MKKKQYRPGWTPPDAVAWCDFHQRGMNYPYIRRKRCLFRRHCSRPCKHLQWFPVTAGRKEDEPS